MQISQKTFTFSQNPLRLTEYEYQHPEIVFRHYFELYGPGETSDILAALQTEALANPHSHYTCASERLQALSCLKELLRVIDAAFVIAQEENEAVCEP